MKISKIKSFYSLNELFSFISDKRKFKIIKYNIYLNKKLDLSIDDYKECFFSKHFPHLFQDYRYQSNSHKFL